MATKSNIHIKKSKKGSLHSALGVKKGDKIPASKLKIKSTDSPALRKKKQFAINAKKWKKEAGGEVYDDPALYDHFIKMSISQAQAGFDDSTQQLQDAQQQNQLDFSGAPDSGFQPIQPNITPQQSAQNLGLMNPPQQQFDTTRVNTNPSTDLQQYLKTPKGQQSAARAKKMGYAVTGIDANGQPTYAKAQRVVTGPNKGVQLFNGAAAIATSIGDSIQEKHNRADEYRNVVKNIAPRFMNNEESEGLNNMPAYTQYGGMKKMGGPIAHGEPVGVVDFNPGSGLDDAMYEGFSHSGPYGKSMIYSGEIGKYAAGGHVSSEKAKEILRDGTAQGHPLTDKQKRYFGWLAGGGKQTGGEVHIAEPNFNFAKGVVPNATDSANYRKDFYDYYYGNPKAIEHVQGIPGQASSAVAGQLPTSKELAYADAQQQTMKKKKQAGGFTPIPTEFNGYPLGVHQAGGVPAGPNPSPVNPQASSVLDQFQSTYGATPDSVQQASAYVNKYRPQLAQALRAKNPDAFGKVDQQLAQLSQEYKKNYTTLLTDKSPVEERTAKLQKAAQDFQQKRQQAIQGAGITDYLDQNAVKKTLGADYDTYIKNQQTIANYNKSRGNNLAGTNEDPNASADATLYGYRSLYESGNTGGGYSKTSGNSSGVTQESGNAQYTIDPATGKPVKNVMTQTKFTPTQQAGGFPDKKNLRVHQTGGYSVGQEVHLTKAQIKDLKKQGYQIEEL